MLVVQYDNDIIVSSAKVSMFNPINAAWEAQFGAPLGRNNMYKVDLMALRHSIDFTSYTSELPNFTTYNNDYLFKYLMNCEGIIMDGCTLITSNVTINSDSVN